MIVAIIGGDSYVEGAFVTWKVRFLHGKRDRYAKDVVVT